MLRSVQYIKSVIERPYRDQLKHWNSREPWKHDGRPVRLDKPVRLTSRDVSIAPNGDLIRITSTVNRPCFGSPVAFLRHGGNRSYNTTNGPRLVRCHQDRCPAAEACAHVAEMRLRATPEIESARGEWMKAGGLNALVRDEKANQLGYARRKWMELIKALESRGEFACVNMDRLKTEIQSSSEKALIADAQRKRQKRLEERERRIVAGEDDAGFAEMLRREIKWRRHTYDAARAHAGAPAWLIRCPPDGGQFDAEVWGARMLLMARGLNPTAGKVAKYLIERGVTTTDNRNGQRNGRVSAALVRVDKLETFRWLEGRPVWPKESVRSLLEDEDYGVFTPYKD